MPDRTRTTSTDPGLDRRRFLQQAGMAGALVAVPSWLAAACSSSDDTKEATGAGESSPGSTVSIKATHGTGLCNLGIFLVKERELAKADGVDLEFVVTPSNADIATLFGAGQVEASLIPYSNFMTLYDQGAPVSIVAGGGNGGCVIVGQEGINSQEDLAGKTLGTFQADTLEVLPFDWLKKAGMSFDDIEVKYFGTSPELAQAFIGGNIDSMCHIEPYATQALKAREGSVKLSDGTDVYGEKYPDCVLAVQNKLLEDQPEAVEALVKALMVAQSEAEKDREAAVKETVGTYYKASYEDVLDASTKQPNVVDQRDHADFIIERGQVMKDLGYVKKLPDKSVFKFDILDKVIKDNAELYESLEVVS